MYRKKTDYTNRRVKFLQHIKCFYVFHKLPYNLLTLKYKDACGVFFFQNLMNSIYLIDVIGRQISSQIQLSHWLLDIIIIRKGKEWDSMKCWIRSYSSNKFTSVFCLDKKSTTKITFYIGQFDLKCISGIFKKYLVFSNSRNFYALTYTIFMTTVERFEQM